jgi:DNA-binding response OmpR family regulator
LGEVSIEVLIVAPDGGVEAGVRAALVESGFAVDTATTGAAALEAGGYDLVVVDTDLPDLDGRELCRLLRSGDPLLPIVMVSDSGSEFDRVLGFEFGADEYVVRPVRAREFALRLRALSRRAGLSRVPYADQDVVGTVRIDRRARRVFVGESEVHFTVKEFDVLAFLCEEPGAVRPRREILRSVWGTEWFGPTKTLDAHVAAIRRKLGDAATITALRGVGFRVDPGPDGSPVGRRPA